MAGVLSIDNRDLVEMSEYQNDRIRAMQARVRELEADQAERILELDKAYRLIANQDLLIAELMSGSGAA